jgi:hypothetical protein
MRTLPVFFLLTAVASGAPTASAPATISKEGDLVTIVLTADAEARLRLKTVPVARRVVPATRLLAGEVVQAPAADRAGLAPLVGGTLEERLRLADLQAAADGRVQVAGAEAAGARLALERSRKILEGEAGSVRAFDEAKTALAVAEAVLDAARAQRALLGAAVSAPEGGGRRWVRTAIFSGEAARLDSRAPAGIRALGASGAPQPAAPVAGPATANPVNATVDWYYELPAAAEARAGERVAVEIPLRDSSDEVRVVPFTAVLHDIHGGQWVYEAISAHTYTRRRVQVARIAGADAVLARGPAVGANIVTDGAAELFGTEFMTGK